MTVQTLGAADFDVDRFLSQTWQRHPLCLADFHKVADPVDPETLAGLALEDHIESRFVRHDASTWQQTEGPFDEFFFKTLPESDWTLLVQAVDLWLPQVAAAKRPFGFIPAWRFDDVMVSYATPRGGVGPHFDFYDVFLIQVTGTRRWQIGQFCDEQTELTIDGGNRILAHFEAQDTVVTNPGDVLYLPPRVAHWGEAITPSTTYSVGFRAPTAAEVLYDLSIELEARGDSRALLDPPLATTRDNESIDPPFVQSVQALIRGVISDDKLIGDWLARYMTRPKYEELLDLTGEERRARLGDTNYINGLTDAERSDQP